MVKRRVGGDRTPEFTVNQQLLLQVCTRLDRLFRQLGVPLLIRAPGGLISLARLDSIEFLAGAPRFFRRAAELVGLKWLRLEPGLRVRLQGGATATFRGDAGNELWNLVQARILDTSPPAPADEGSADEGGKPEERVDAVDLAASMDDDEADDRVIEFPGQEGGEEPSIDDDDEPEAGA